MSTPAPNPQHGKLPSGDLRAELASESTQGDLSSPGPMTRQALPQWQHDVVSDRVAKIAAAIQQQVMPTLAETRRPIRRVAQSQSTKGGAPHIGSVAADQRRLTRALLADDMLSAERIIGNLHLRGVAADVILSMVLTDSARELGDLWEADCCSFVDVTLGLGRLHQLMVGVSAQFHASRQAPTIEKRIVLNLTPGEDHRFGLAMVSEYLDRAGWEVLRPEASTSRELADHIRAERCGLVGLSIGSEEHLASLMDCIATIRRLHNDRGGIAIMAGGPLFLRKPEISHKLGVDSVCTSADEAVRQAETLFALMSAMGEAAFGEETGNRSMMGRER